MAGKTDGRQLRWDSHNAGAPRAHHRRRHRRPRRVRAGRGGARPADRRPRGAEPDRRLPPLRRPRRPRRAPCRAGVLELLARRAGAGAVLRGHPVEIIRRIVVGVRRVGQRAPGAARVRPAGPARPGRRSDGAGDPADRRPDRGPHQRRRRGAARPARRGRAWPRSTRWSSGWSARCSPRPGAGCPGPSAARRAAAFVELVTEAVWHQIAGMAGAPRRRARPRTSRSRRCSRRPSTGTVTG